MATEPSLRSRSRVGESVSCGFTLTELLIVLGLIALLISLLLPVVGRMRSTAAAVACISNLRQMCIAWTMSMAGDGRLIEDVWHTSRPDVAWNGYWPGAMEKSQVSPRVLLCPRASEPTPVSTNGGYGTADFAWTGRHASFGTPVRYNANTYRDSSYGFNRYLTSTGGFGAAGTAALSDVKNPSNVPAFMDCAYVDVRPVNGSKAHPVQPPPNLRGDSVAPGKPEHWKFILARHGRGINVVMADGSARWVRLEELYSLSWKADWAPYLLVLSTQ